MFSSMLACRFCAEDISTKAAINLKTELEIREAVIEKLSFFKDEFLDFNDNNLPETVCGGCVKDLDSCYKFFLKVKEAQVVLRHVYKSDDTKVFVKDENIIEDDLSADAEYLISAPDYIDTSWTSYRWNCIHCPKVFTTVTNLRLHSQEQHNTCYGYQCVDCDEKINVFDEFVKHVRTHREELRYYCEFCNIKTEDDQHKETHLDENFCTFCGQMFQNEPDLLLHLKKYVSKDTGLLAFDLAICESLAPTEVTNWSNYPSICRFCKLKVGSRDILTCHCIEVHGCCFGTQCVDCDDSPDNFMEFVYHVGLHRPDFKTQCPYCEVNADVQHIESHTTNKYPCSVCGEIFTKKRSLKYHQLKTNQSSVKRRKRPSTVKDLSCNECGVVLKRHQSMKSHKLLHTERKRNYTCDKCGLSFYTKGALTAHYRVHGSQQRVTCKICNKSISNNIKLRQHLQTHNLEKPYQCDGCKKKFNTKSSLRYHILVTHMNIKRYNCKYCEKKFKYHHTMKIHENQHLGVKPYSCETCFMEFSNWSNCNKHMKRKHGTSLAKTAYTPQGRILLNPKTGKPHQLETSKGVKEWSEKIFKGKRKLKQSVYNIEFRLKDNE